MASQQYGKIINGQLMKAPSQIIDDGCAYCGVPDAVYRKYGYKPVEYTAQPENIPCGCRPIYIWEDNPDTINQIWKFELLSDDYTEQLRKSKGRFNITLHRIKEGIKSYCKQQNDKMLAAIKQDSIIEKAYTKLVNSEDQSNIADIIQKYKKQVPRNFFEEVGISDYLRSNGYIINTSNEVLFFHDEKNIFTMKHPELLDFIDGKVYVKNSNRELYPVPSFAAIRFSDSQYPMIIDPVMILFSLQQIAELYESFHASNLYFTMAFTYLHTIMDDFITSLIRFYICSYPKGADLSKNISSADILSVISMTDLENLKNNIIEEKVASFGHNSYQDKVEFLNKRGISFTIDQTMWRDDMIWFCERRNAIVHNASIVNQTIIKKLAGTLYHEKISLGEDISPDYDTLMTAITLVETVCNDIYNVTKSKFNF